MRRCPKCDSDNTVRVLSAKAVLVLPELREEVEEGRAIICTSCRGTGNGKTFKCNDCRLQWDDFMEDAIRQNKKIRHSYSEAKL